MQGQQTFIFECSRINSVGVESTDENYDDKSSWTNKIRPTLLKQGDNVTLQNVLINIGGANTNSIQFEGTQTTPSNNIVDNYTMLDIGFYVNHNGINTSALPLIYETNDTPTAIRTLVTDTDKTDDTGLIRNSYGSLPDYQYLYDGNDNPTGGPSQVQRIATIPQVQSCTPYFGNNSNKFAIIDPTYTGWMRPQIDGHNGLGIEPKLLTQSIPIELNKGFTSPTGIADKITQILNSTNKLYSSDLFLPTSNKYKQDDSAHSDKLEIRAYNLNGYCLKTKSCNLQKTDDSYHRIYGNMAVDEPYMWKYGMNIISNVKVDNLLGNPYMKDTLTNYDLLKVDYPVIIWNRFIGDNEINFDVGIDNQYYNYSPYDTSLITGSDIALTITGMTLNFIEFNGSYFNKMETNNVGCYLYKDTESSYKLVRTDVIGTNLSNKPSLFVDNDNAAKSRLLNYTRLLGIGGIWHATEHQIFRTTDNFDEYIYDGLNANAFFEYFVGFKDVIGLKQEVGNGNDRKYVGNILTQSSGGIIEGGSYVLSFELELTNGTGGATSENYGFNVGITGTNVGITEGVYFSDGTYTVSFISTGNNNGSDAIQFFITGVDDNYGGTRISIKNISFLRNNIKQDEPYSVTDTWSGDYTNPENNKFYTYSRNSSIATIKMEITDCEFNSAFNGIYDVVANGLVGQIQGGGCILTNLLNGQNIYSSILFKDDPENNRSFFILKDYDYVDKWVGIEIDQYNGGKVENGVVLASIQSLIELKDEVYNGQLFYNFEGTTFLLETTFVDFGGIDWYDEQDLIYELDEYNIDELETETVDGQEFSYNLLFRKYSETVEREILDELFLNYNSNGTTGNWRDSNGNEGTWSYDGEMITLTSTIGTSNSLYSPVAPAINHTYINEDIEFLEVDDFDNPPSLPWTPGRYYYYSFGRFVGIDEGNLTYYISLPLVDTEDSLAGLAGTIYRSDETLEGNWSYNANSGIFISGIIGDEFQLDGNVNLKEGVTYETSTTLQIGGDAYNLPKNGIQSGDYNTYGETEITQQQSSVKYLSWNNATDPDNLNTDITEGFVYDNEDDIFTNNNGQKWRLIQDSLNEVYKLEIYNVDDEIVELTLEAPYSQIIPTGWQLISCDKIISFANGSSLLNVEKMGTPGSTTQTLGNGQESIQTGTYNITENYTSTVVDNGTFTNFSDKTINTDTASIQKHQLLMTNVLYTMENVKMFEQFFRKNEVYIGNKINRTDIIADTENYYVKFDLGRGDDSDVDYANINASANETGFTPLQPYYMWDSGQMHKTVDDTGSVCPRYGPNGNEQRIKIFTRWEDYYEKRYVANNMLGYQYNYGNEITTNQFKTDYSDLYNYVSKNNIGIIPFMGKDNILKMGFETYQDYTNGELYKIQNFTYFVYSPSIVDHNYVTMWNNDAPSIKDSDYNYTTHSQDQMNFINVGAHKPAMIYNNDLNKFGFQYWHFPTYFNEQTGTSDNIGQEIARLYDSSDNIIFLNKVIRHASDYVDDGRRNIGINDSQSGIFLNDIYFRKQGEREILNIGDDNLVLMTTDNYYGSLWFKLGFTYYDFKNIKFIEKSFNENRFSQLSYNNVIDTSIRMDSLTPFTTNSLVNINNSPAINIFSQNSGTQATINPNTGTPIYGLGYNNNMTAAIQVESATMYSTSIPVNISSAYYRIYTDLPIDTLNYNANGSNLSCIGYALLNYSSSGQFFFSYGMDFGSTITKDIVISDIKIEIRNDRGQILRGLGDRSSVILKATRNIEFGMTSIPKNIMNREPEEFGTELIDENINILLNNLNYNDPTSQLPVRESIKQPQTQKQTQKQRHLTNMDINRLHDSINKFRGDPTYYRSNPGTQEEGRLLLNAINEKKGNVSVEQFKKIEVLNENLKQAVKKGDENVFKQVNQEIRKLKNEIIRDEK